MAKIGDKIRIIDLHGDPASGHYIGKVGIITRTSIDYTHMTQYWGTWGGIAVYDGEFEVCNEESE